MVRLTSTAVYQFVTCLSHSLGLGLEKSRQNCRESITQLQMESSGSRKKPVGVQFITLL